MILVDPLKIDILIYFINRSNNIIGHHCSKPGVFDTPILALALFGQLAVNLCMREDLPTLLAPKKQTSGNSGFGMCWGFLNLPKVYMGLFLK